MKLLPNLRAFADPLCEAMVEFYSISQKKFTPGNTCYFMKK